MLSSAAIKHINALKIKKYRCKYREFVAEGPKLVSELMLNGIKIKKLYYEESLQEDFSRYDFSEEVGEDSLQKITHLHSHPYKVLAICEMPDYRLHDGLKEGKWYLALDDIQDPGNMGTIIRTADWFGIDTLLISPACVDVYNSKVVQATMASIARVRTAEVDLYEILNSHNDIPVYGAVLDGENIFTIKDKKPGILLIGNEGKGISPHLLPMITQKITIPGRGNVESLNAAISAGIILAWADGGL